MVKIGAPLAIVAFILLNFFIELPFLKNIDPSLLSKKAKIIYDSVCAEVFPVALLIEHVYVLPFNSKPAALIYVTDQYSWSDTFKFGIVMMIIGWAMSILMSMTYFKYMGITPNGLF